LAVAADHDVCISAQAWECLGQWSPKTGQPLIKAMARLKRLGAMPYEVVSEVRSYNSRRSCGFAESLKIFLNDVFLGHLIFLITTNRLPIQAAPMYFECKSKVKLLICGYSSRQQRLSLSYDRGSRENIIVRRQKT
jgi:hypothetical protein